jgi:hypothetical protein
MVSTLPTLSSALLVNWIRSTWLVEKTNCLVLSNFFVIVVIIEELKKSIPRTLGTLLTYVLALHVRTNFLL